MNFLAHARDHLDEAYATIGTALPDLISMGDRRCRLREEHLPAPDGLDHVSRALVRGLRAHFVDDKWFHQTAAFDEVTSEIAARIRAAYPGNTRLRASVLGHIGMEMLLDAELSTRDPDLLRRYYVALSVVAPHEVAERVNRWAPRPALRLPWVIRFFRHARFLGSYLDDDGFSLRLGQVSSRVGMGRLPPTFVGLVPEFRRLVADRADDLLRAPPRA